MRCARRLPHGKLSRLAADPEREVRKVVAQRLPAFALGRLLFDQLIKAALVVFPDLLRIAFLLDLLHLGELPALASVHAFDCVEQLTLVGNERQHLPEGQTLTMPQPLTL